jgi:IS30 family transposase/transposase
VREEFLAGVRAGGSVTEVAARMGLSRNTGYGWVRKAGLARKRSDRPTREDFHRLRGEGLSRGEAAERLGIHRTTAQEWDNGVHKLGNGRRYRDGRVVDYNIPMEARAPSVSAAVPLAGVEKPLDPRYLSLPERERIGDLLAAGATLREIGRQLGRPASIVSREIARNSTDGQYLPYAAQRAAAVRRPRPRQAKLARPGPLRDYVAGKLATRWSPEQICHALVQDYPHDAEMRVCHETVYQSIYVQARGGLRREVAASLRTGRAVRRPHRTGTERIPRFEGMVMISDRPAEVQDRAVPGHWEGDLITGASNRSAIGTLVERTTRYVMLLHLPHGHDAASVRDALIETVQTLPEHLRGSLTWDQGSEMARHRTFSLATGMDVYFCDPASPWQRGTNENTNGLLRQYFPKGTDLSVHGREDLEHVAQELNARPRKTLGWKTPAERLRDLLPST